MKNKIDASVAAIFENYEETSQLKDFKEEITVNLLEKVRDYMQKGADEDEATGKALSELGDITEIADSIGRQKRKEAIEDYFFQKRPLERRHAIGFSVAGVVLVLGFVAAFVLGFRGGAIGKAALLFLPFGLISVCSFVFIGLTRETNAHYPMKRKKSALFAAAAGLICIGVFLGGAILFWDTSYSEFALTNIAAFKAERVMLMLGPSLVVLLGFILPGVAMMCYLVLTQEKRLKPWVIEHIRRSNGVYGEKFGMLCATIWTFAFAVFVLFGFLAGWHLAWIVFLFAIAIQMLAMFLMAERK